MISVTVLAPNALDAEVIATYLFVTDIESGLEYVNKSDDLEAIWCYFADETSYDCIRSKNFDSNI